MATPLCQYFGTCGGCTAQHIDYTLQIENKRKQLQSMMKTEAVQVFFDKEYGYRNRMDFIFHTKGLGLRKKGQLDSIIPIQHCVIAEKKINQIVQEIEQAFNDCDAFDVRKHSGTFRYAVIRSSPIDSSLSFVLNSNSPRLQEAIEKAKAFAEHCSAQNILISYVPAQSDVSTSSDYFVIKGKDFLQTTFMDKIFSYPIQGFFQNNHHMAEKMQNYVSQLLKQYETKNALLLDLYGGVGTFGIVNAGYFKEVLVIESVKESIDFAQKNIEQNNYTHVKGMVLDAKQISRVSCKKPFFVITDPPRSGMDQKTIRYLNQEKPACIIYISCNPQQMQKDVLKFRNYSVKSVALFDLFPQTPHSEAIVELVLKDTEDLK